MDEAALRYGRRQRVRAGYLYFLGYRELARAGLKDERLEGTCVVVQETFQGLVVKTVYKEPRGPSQVRRNNARKSKVRRDRANRMAY